MNTKDKRRNKDNLNDNVKLFLKQQYNTINDKFDPNKETIVICDDNYGICLFLREDLQTITDKNILIFYGENAVYKCIAFCERENLTPEYAILDIIFNGLFRTEDERIRLTGVDLFDYLINKNSDLKYCFFTGSITDSGNALIDDLMKQYKKITNTDIQQKTITKLTLNSKDRLKKIQEMLGL